MRLPWIVLVVMLAGCGGNKSPERTERERDSLIAQSRLPGAAGVKAALKVSDSATVRGARLDSVTQ